MSIVTAQLGMASREEKRNKLTLTELDALPAGTKTYMAVGKMFLQVFACHLFLHLSPRL
jgi:hypothetical protein